MSLTQLTEHEEAILRYIESDTPAIWQILEEFNDALSVKQVNFAMGVLNVRKYIKTERVLKFGVYSLYEETKEEDFEDIYKLTPLGKNYIANKTANFTSFSNITNSNIAHHSKNIEQQITLSELPKDIQEKIAILAKAAKDKDANTMKKAYGYIADKSVDVAIAITTGALLR